MSPTLNSSSVLQRFECGNVIEICNGILFDSTWDCHVLGGIVHVAGVFSATQQGQAGFMDAACRELPTKSLQEVEQHEQWYTEYCTLLESKRKAIQAWKNQKKVSMMMRTASATRGW